MVDLLVREDSTTAAPFDPAVTPGIAGSSATPDRARPVTPGFEWPRTARRLQSAFRGHPYRQDVALALTVFLLTLRPPQAGKPPELRRAGALLVTTSVIQSATLIWRLRLPLPTYFVALAACTVEWAASLSSSSDVSLMICLYTIARYRSLMTLRVALCAIVPPLIVMVCQMPPAQGPTLLSLFFLGTAVAGGGGGGGGGRRGEGEKEGKGGRLGYGRVGNAPPGHVRAHVA